MDLLSAVNIFQATEEEGVNQVVGFCDTRPETDREDLAHELTANAMLSVATDQVFPCE